MVGCEPLEHVLGGMNGFELVLVVEKGFEGGVAANAGRRLIGIRKHLLPAQLLGLDLLKIEQRFLQIAGIANALALPDQFIEGHHQRCASHQLSMTQL